MKKKKLTGSLLLILTAAIWGSAFVAQSAGMDYAGPFTFNGVRSLIGAAVLVPAALLFRSKTATDRRATWLGGLLCGLALFLATNLQQMGIQYTEVGKAGFITTFYIVLVPVLSVLWGRRPGPLTWVAVLLALGGLYCLCMQPGAVSIQRGDFYVLLCALCFAGQIMLVDKYAPRADGVLLSCIQFAVCGVLSLLTAFIVETPDFPALFRGWVPLLYAGVLSSGVAYTLQIVGQRHLSPTVASLLMSLESVFAVLAGWLLLRESLSGRELFGCGLMFTAVILAQLAPEKSSRKSAA